MKFLTFIKREFFEVLPPILFFFATFNILLFSESLMLDQYGIEFSGFAAASIGAIVLGKVVLITDHLPFINKFPARPLIYNIVWKTSIYIIVAFIVRLIEHLIPFLIQYKHFELAFSHLYNEVVWTHFLLIQIWLFILLLGYTTFHELGRSLGKEKMTYLFFGGKKPVE